MPRCCRQIGKIERGRERPSVLLPASELAVKKQKKSQRAGNRVAKEILAYIVS